MAMTMQRPRQVEFSQPVRQILLMLGALAAVAALGWALYAPIETVVRANLYLSALIAGVFAIGVLASFGAVARLSAAVGWLEGFASDRAGHEFAAPPALMRSVAALMRDRGARMGLSATSTRSILDSVATRLDETRDIMRYIGNLLIFLGLLGTFWGLSTTVPAVVETIRSLAPGDGGDSAGVFDRLMAGLEDQLGGMGTAFSSSLLGLAGSLVIGLLELFVGHAQNRFFRELEEWLSSITRISAGEGAGEGGDSAIAAQLAEQNAAQIEALTRIFGNEEAKLEAFESRIAALTDSVSRLTGAMGEGRDAKAVAALERIAARLDRAAEDGDDLTGAEAAARLRSIDRTLMRLSDELAEGRQETAADLREDLAALARAVEALAGRREG